MKTYMKRSAIAIIFPFVALHLHGQITKATVPPDLDTEILLILTYDEVQLDGTESKGQAARIRKHNDRMRKANASIEKAVAKYPYRYALARRSDYYAQNQEMIPEHRYVIDSAIMQGFQNYEKVRTEVDLGGTTVFVSEVYLWDVETKERYMIFGETPAVRQVDRFQDVLRFMTNRFQRGKG